MQIFLRLQLQGSQSDDYPPLWQALKTRGFLKTIVAEDGVRYKLPNGTYMIEDMTPAQAFKLASAATVEVGVEGRFLLIEGMPFMSQLEPFNELHEQLLQALATLTKR